MEGSHQRTQPGDGRAHGGVMTPEEFVFWLIGYSSARGSNFDRTEVERMARDVACHHAGVPRLLMKTLSVPDPGHVDIPIPLPWQRPVLAPSIFGLHRHPAEGTPILPAVATSWVPGLAPFPSLADADVRCMDDTSIPVGEVQELS